MSPVPRITSSIEELNTTRGRSITALLKKVANKGDRISFNTRSIGGRAFIIAISDTMETGSDFTTWRFKTYVDDYHAMYHEIWRPLHENIYFLERSYFHLYKTKQTKLNEEEFILLHCDVSEPDDVPHAKYKQSPHLHIQSAEQPLPHAHFALNNCDLQSTLSSLENLNIALRNAIEMIDDQVLFIIASQ